MADDQLIAPNLVIALQVDVMLDETLERRRRKLRRRMRFSKGCVGFLGRDSVRRRVPRFRLVLSARNAPPLANSKPILLRFDQSAQQFLTLGGVGERADPELLHEVVGKGGNDFIDIGLR